jgi:L-lactate dehydrogenase complex protein LldG
MSTARDTILGRVRAALRTPAPAPPPAPAGSAVFPPVSDPAARFRDEFLALGGETIEPGEPLRAFLTGFARIATDGSDIVQRTAGPGNAEVREADLGITGCDCLVARMGAIVVSTGTAGGRACSVLPPVHLVVATRDQLLPDLADAIGLLRRRYDGRWPSTLSIIAGASRTSDIEKVLVRGAHGPTRLVLCWADAADRPSANG